MQALLIANTAALAVVVVFCTICFIGWFKAEKKLAKYNQSKIFKKRRIKNDKKSGR